MALLRNKHIYNVYSNICKSSALPYKLRSLTRICEENQLLKRNLCISCIDIHRALYLPGKFLERKCHAVKNSEVSTEENEDTVKTKERLRKGPGFDYFLSNLNVNLSKRELKKISHPYIPAGDLNGHGQKVFFKIYGCQMNVSDGDVAWSILKKNGYCLANSMDEANIILIVTCAIREGAEEKIWRQLKLLRSVKNKKKSLKIGVLGCMAERIGSKIIEKESIVDVVAGPDSYKDLPRLLAISNEGEKTVNILLSHDETYADVNPVSIASSKVSAFVSIMRGCDNMCSYCIVPFTRGRERSRDIESILDEIRYLSDEGIKEITLLGQNVNSYRDTSETQYIGGFDTKPTELAKGFQTIYKNKVGGLRFADLLDKASLINPEIRIRFTSPHPKDFHDEVLYVIKERKNICNNLHLPAQCGSSRILDLMNRGYSRESYLELVWHIKSIIPSVTLSSDIICGFCGETEEEFEETLSLMEKVQFNFCYVFPYSMRDKTSAHRNLVDDVPQHVKMDRLKRLNNVFRKIAHILNLSRVGQRQLILIAGKSKRSQVQLIGRNESNIPVIIPDTEIVLNENETEGQHAQPGDYVEVQIIDASSQCLKGVPIKFSSLQTFEH